MRMRMRSGSMLAAALVCAVGALLAAPGEARAALRVCADPGNMPLSNNKGEGFENKIAAVLAKGLDQPGRGGLVERETPNLGPEPDVRTDGQVLGHPLEVVEDRSLE